MHGGKKKMYLVIISFLFGVFFGQYIPDVVYTFNPTGDRGAWFVKRCADLNGKNFTYNNLLSLKGYIGLGEDQYEGEKYVSGSFGHYVFDKKYLDEYLSGRFLVNDGSKQFKKAKYIMISPEDKSFSIAEAQGVEGIWSCRIIPDANKKTMKTYPSWLQVH